jgi:hypothetical protein
MSECVTTFSLSMLEQIQDRNAGGTFKSVLNPNMCHRTIQKSSRTLNSRIFQRKHPLHGRGISFPLVPCRGKDVGHQRSRHGDQRPKVEGRGFAKEKNAFHSLSSRNLQIQFGSTRVPSNLTEPAGTQACCVHVQWRKGALKGLRMRLG